MKEHKDVTACVVDFGMVGVPMAERLARDFKCVYLFQDWEEKYSTLNRAICGDGYDNFERVSDLWSIKDEVDLFVFPDIQRSGLQLELERQGYKIWGSRDGDIYEKDRELHLKTLSQIGLDVPDFHIKVGLTELRNFLKDKKDYYIKISMFRGSFETSHFRSMAEDEAWLDSLGVRFGSAANFVRFLCFPNIKTPFEIGADTYCVDGKWPNKLLHGVEWKDRSYLGVVTEMEELPKEIRKVLNGFSPVLGKHRYRNQFSMEVRIKGPKSYFTDPTCRMGLPSTASQLELYKNFGEIVWHGANGELVQPKLEARYTAEAIIKCEGDPKEEWRVVKMPDALKRWCKFKDVCEIGGLTVFPADDSCGWAEVGWLVAIGDSVEDVVHKINGYADMLPDGMDANTEALGYVIKEIHQLEHQGIKFGNKPLPKPGVVLD